MPIYLFEIKRRDHDHLDTIEVGADDEWQALKVIAQAHPGAEIVRKVLEYPSHIKPGTA